MLLLVSLKNHTAHPPLGCGASPARRGIMWQTHFGEIGVSAKDIEMLEQTIDSEPLRSQRIKFDPNRFGAITKKKKPKNPMA